MFQNQVAPTGSVGGESSAVTPTVVPVVVVGEQTNTARGTSLKLTPECRAKMWSLVNLIFPAFDVIFGSFNFFHTIFHEEHPSPADELDLELYCHTGSGALHTLLWGLLMLGFIIYYVISVLFIVAAFSSKKDSKIRLRYVKIYWILCMVPIHLAVPSLHFIVKVWWCWEETHFWGYYFFSLVLLLIPMTVIGYFVAKHFRRWLSDLIRLLQSGEPAIALVVVINGNDDEHLPLPDALEPENL